jgi:hypothetical protein
LPPGQQDSLLGTLLNGRILIDIDGFKLDLGTLGGTNSSSNWGEINDFGQIVGDSETAVPDPNGEDICGFGTHLTCRPFLWQFLQMSALPTLGGNNGQASAINNRGRIVGFAENGAVDSTCPPNTTNNRIALPVLWEKGTAKPLPLVGNDPDGDAFWINDQGQAVGYSGNCTECCARLRLRHAEVLVLGRHGYETAVQGKNGFVWLWNDRGLLESTIRTPGTLNCGLRSALMLRRHGPTSHRTINKTELVIAGRTKAQMFDMIAAAIDKKELPAPEPGAMCYMMSRQDYLNDRDGHWRPHLMFFHSGNRSQSLGRRFSKLADHRV